MHRPHLLPQSARLAAALLAVLAVLLPAAPAWAHNALRESTPSRDARVPSAPRQVELVFAERLDPQFTTIAVTGPGDAAVTAGAPAVSGTRATQPVNPDLPAGEYTVSYRVVSVDGHPVQGSFAFTVTSTPTRSASPTPSATISPPSAAPAAAAAAQTDNADGGSGAAVVVAVLAVAAAGAGVLIRRVRAGRR
ncbi:copper resistance protein CopC [Micromonospora endolithica]|uniref:Copper resistance protein CopC n=1 Tax=Micromonospora endolithica TaxID=230091 RepID=A0A3A9ZSP0_9ACTN|nr:copper resistance protein CopC [Micromonospora endolithica]